MHSPSVPLLGKTGFDVQYKIFAISQTQSPKYLGAHQNQAELVFLKKLLAKRIRVKQSHQESPGWISLFKLAFLFIFIFYFIFLKIYRNINFFGKID